MIRAKIESSIKKGLKASEKNCAFTVEVPENYAHGDYSTNVALILGRRTGKNPREAAALLEAKLSKEPLFKKVEIAGPGFLNFWISDLFLKKELAARMSARSYGRGLRKKEKIQVEFVSANPTGPLTLANGRGGFLGDVLSNVLELSGYRIEREYYVNDTGNQILTFGKSMCAAVGLIPQEDTFYKGAYVKEWAASHQSFIKKTKDPMKVGKRAAKDFLGIIRRTLEKHARIRYDRYTSEDRDIHGAQFIKKTLEIFKKASAVYEKDGALWLKTTEFGDDKDRVLITGDGFPTYFLADAGHYLETAKRGFDLKINLLGPDHYGYVSRIQAAAKLIGLKRSEIIVTQAIRLLREGKEVKMSKRAGEFVTFEELIEEVGVDAARFFFLEKSPDTHIDFNLDLAKERSSQNPVYYMQYAHARMASIMQKAPRKIGGKSFSINLLTSSEERLLINKVIQFPEIVEDISKDFHVHRLPRYALELSRIFHNFYEKHRVITEDPKLSCARLLLVDAVRRTLKDALTLLGISVPAKM